MVTRARIEMGFNLLPNFKKTTCIKCGIELPCRHVTETARCTECLYRDYYEKMKEEKQKVKEEEWGY